MLALLWGFDGFHVVELMVEQQSDNAHYIHRHRMEPPLRVTISRRPEYRGIKSLISPDVLSYDDLRKLCSFVIWTDPVMGSM
jgi:hypothetical protein